jgi:hypothetical protein
MNLERWEKSSATIGAAAWAVLAGMAGFGKAPLGVIELLFLFAPLVVAPLGMALGRRLVPLRHSGLENFFGVFQPFAAAAVVVAFWLAPGRLSGLLAAPWLVLCLGLAAEGLFTGSRRAHRNLMGFAVNLGRMDLAVAGAWLVASRLGLRPLGIQEPIILLTAVHFHYTGFATAQIAAALMAGTRRQDAPGWLKSAVALVMAVPFLVAVGFVWSPVLKMVAAVILAVSVAVLAGVQFWRAGQLASASACVFLRVSAGTVLAGMVLAGVYAVGDCLGRDWLLIPRMATTHGLLNGLGFVLCGLLGWLVEPAN